MKRFLGIGVAGGFASLLSSFAVAQAPSPTQAPSTAQQVPAITAQENIGEYPIGPKDLLEIRVLEVPELNVER